MKTAGGNETALKPLSANYIRQRARDPNLSSETSPSTSNLTRYGDMLDALDYKISNGKLTVTIIDADNVKKASFTHDVRPWVNLSRADVLAIRELVNEMLGQEIGKL